MIPGDYVTTEDGTGIVHIAPTFGADDKKVADAAGVPGLYMQTKNNGPRPMVDFTGKYWRVEDLDEEWYKANVNDELYRRYAGRWVKNAYDPQFTIDGKYTSDKLFATINLDVASQKIDIVVGTDDFVVNILGDLNDDGVVNFTDATSILTVMGSGEYNVAADVNNDGIVNFTDYMSILTVMANQ